MSKINAIDTHDIHRITSGQVIIDISTAVKELVDNSIDADASQIDIVFKNYGIDSFECSDDGKGIEPGDYEGLAMKHHTSKISSFQDVSTVRTLGFRGEALSSLCAISQVVVTTTVNPPRADKIEYDINGNIYSKTTTSRNKGTTVQVSDLFYNLPVRRKELTKTGKRQFAKSVTLLQSYGIINTDIKFSVSHITASGKKQRIFTTLNNKGIQKNILNIFGSASLHGLSGIDIHLNLNPYKPQFCNRYSEDLTFDGLDYQIQVEGLISKSSFGSGRSNKDRQFVYINKRPIEYPALVKCCNDIYKQFNNIQYPAFFLNFLVSPDLIDVNVTPDKRTVILHNERYVIDIFREELTNYFKNQDLLLPKQERTTLEEPLLKNEFEQSPTNLKISQEVTSAAINTLSEVDKDIPNEKHLSSEIDIPFEINTQIQSSTFGSVDAQTNEYTQEYKNSDTTTALQEEEYKTNHQDLNSNIETTEGLERVSYANEDYRIPISSTSPLVCLDSFKNPSVDESNLPSTGTRQKDINIEHLVIDIDGKSEEHAVRLTQNEELLFVSNKIEIPRSTEPSSKEKNHNRFAEGRFITKDPSDEHLDDEPPSQEINIRTPIREIRRQITGSKSRLINSESKKTYLKGKDEPIYMTNLFLDASHDIAKENAINFKFLEYVKSTRHSRKIKQNHKIDDIEEGERFLTLTIKKEEFNNMEVIGQFNLGFIITSCKIGDKSNMFIIDQHASDEKYNFETLQKNTSFKSQSLISPQPVELSVVDELIVLENLEVFEKNGFKVDIDDEAQGCKIKLTNLPVSKRTLFDIEDFNELIQLVKTNDGINKDSIKCSKIRSMFAMRACRSSIMIGKPLNTKVMKRVVRNLSSLEKPWNCPHGRPTMRHLMELKDWDSFIDDYEV